MCILLSFGFTITGSIAQTPPDGTLKSVEDTVVFDLYNSDNQPTYIDIPVYITSDTIINSLDFSFYFDTIDLTFDSVIDLAGYLTTLYNTPENNKLSFTSYSMENYAINEPLVLLRFLKNTGNVNSSDLDTVNAYTNGDPASHLITDIATEYNPVPEPDNMIKVYPNPCNGIFNLEITGIEKSHKIIYVYDLSGKTVYEKKAGSGYFFSDKIDISKYQNGIYLLNVRIGNIKYTKNIIVE